MKKMKKKTVLLCIALACFVILAIVIGLILALKSRDHSPSWRSSYNLGVRYLENGNYNEAVLYLSLSISVKERTENYMARAEAYTQLREFSKAAQDYRNAAELDGKNPEVWLKLADSLNEDGDTEAAAEALRDGLEATGDDPDIAKRLRDLERDDTWPDFTPDPSLPRIRVGTVEELLKALEEHPTDTVIVLEEGDYKTDWGIYLSELRNVTLVADGTVRILAGSEEDLVLGFGDCDNLTLDGIVIGHDPLSVEGGCTAGVVEIYCYRDDGALSTINFVDCDIFGCGFLGISASGDVKLSAVGTTVRDCSCYALDLNCEADFYGCTFSGNGYMYKNNEFMWASAESKTHFYSCDFKGNFNNTFRNEEALCSFEDCSFSGNGWD